MTPSTGTPPWKALLKPMTAPGNKAARTWMRCLAISPGHSSGGRPVKTPSAMR